MTDGRGGRLSDRARAQSLPGATVFCLGSFRVLAPDGTDITPTSALRQAIRACRKGGRLSAPGVYGGTLDRFPIGALMQKGLQLRTGQTHVQQYMKELLGRIEAGEIDTTFLISHRLPLEAAPEGYANFRSRPNDWTKVVLKPGVG